MAIKKAPIVPQSDLVNKVINAGSPPAEQAKDDSKEIEKEIKFVMTIPIEIADKIEEVRGRSRSSRRSWFLIAAIEKLKKDYKIDFSTSKGIGKGIQRNYINGKYCYNVIIYLGTSAKSGTKNIVIDGNNGEVISESNHQYNEENDERI